MNGNIIGAVITFALGGVVSYLSFLISKSILIKQPEKFAFSTVLRQTIQIFYLVAVYFISKYISWDTWYMLIGAVVGVTVPMIYFTHKLLQINQSNNTKNEKKDGEDNG
ncbi:MAG: hypothetical protein IKW45_02950 [Clostridia bacterium]|nr:hypothetical protein [Clostridia bacterium]